MPPPTKRSKVRQHEVRRNGYNTNRTITYDNCITSDSVGWNDKPGLLLSAPALDIPFHGAMQNSKQSQVMSTDISVKRDNQRIRQMEWNITAQHELPASREQSNCRTKTSPAQSRLKGADRVWACMLSMLMIIQCTSNNLVTQAGTQHLQVHSLPNSQLYLVDVSRSNLQTSDMIQVLSCVVSATCCSHYTVHTPPIIDWD